MDLQRWNHAQDSVGGAFELSVLLQKRCRELTRGACKLVDFESRNPVEIALEEVLQGKIHLAPAPPPEIKQQELEELRRRLDEEGPAGVLAYLRPTDPPRIPPKPMTASGGESAD